MWTAQGVVGVFIDDSGPGIPEEEFSKVCDRFFRGRNKTTMGSGLGLAIAYLAAERLDVEITLQNRTEGGLRAGLRFRSVTRVP